MAEQRIAQIVKALEEKKAGTRNSSQMRVVAFDLMIDVEMRQEQAASLGRAGRRIGAAIAEMREHAAAWRVDVGAREDHVRAFEEACRNALRYRWELVVQREAMGITDHTELDRVYPIQQKLF